MSNEEDRYKALVDGPWLIYDHYLTVREWYPNFQPCSASIEKVAVWIRFSELPLEYYDSKILKNVGNRIGRTVKVDRNILLTARWKYVRLCVEVDLTKPLLAFIDIKDKICRIEYEGLHLLCLACGKFGHYMEGCDAKNNEGNRGEQSHNHGGNQAGENINATTEAGP